MSRVWIFMWGEREKKITRRAATCCVISRGWSIDRWQFSDTSGWSWTDWSSSRTSCTRISSCWIVWFSRHNIPRHRRGLTYKLFFFFFGWKRAKAIGNSISQRHILPKYQIGQWEFSIKWKDWKSCVEIQKQI